MKVIPTLLALLMAGILGCSVEVQDTVPAKTPEKKKPSTAKVIIDGATGKTAVDSYFNAKAQIKEIEDSQQKRLDGIEDNK